MSTICECGNHVFKTVSRRWVVMVSAEDEGELCNLETRTMACGYVMVVKVRNVGGKRRYRGFARLIAGTPKGLVTDHISRNTLDNRRANLRTATVSQNAVNSKNRVRKTDLPRGVVRSGNRFMVIIRAHPAPQKSLGTFATPEDASRVYEAARLRAFGEFVPSPVNHFGHTASPLVRGQV